MYLKVIKPVFDFVVSAFGLLLLGPVLILVSLILFFIHGSSPVFTQTRVGQFGNCFTILKLKTIKDNGKSHWFLKLLRKTKIDELPQFINILKGDMSLVGPRPDLPGYYDTLEGDKAKVLLLKPGITGYATLQFANEEELLAKETHPRDYNDRVIFPKKVDLNFDYYKHVSFLFDLKILLKTILLPFYKSSVYL